MYLDLNGHSREDEQCCQRRRAVVPCKRAAAVPGHERRARLTPIIVSIPDVLLYRQLSVCPAFALSLGTGQTKERRYDTPISNQTIFLPSSRAGNRGVPSVVVIRAVAGMFGERGRKDDGGRGMKRQVGRFLDQLAPNLQIGQSKI